MNQLLVTRVPESKMILITLWGKTAHIICRVDSSRVSIMSFTIFLSRNIMGVQKDFCQVTLSWFGDLIPCFL